MENLYARLGAHGPHLCFAGHTDVVNAGDEATWSHPPFAGVIADARLYGRGAVDMKGGIACFLAAAIAHLQGNGGLRRGSLSLLITGDEELVAINGTRKLLDWLKQRQEKIDACLVGEPTSADVLGDEVKIGRRGYLNASVVVHGKQGHSAYGEKAENPIPKLARIIVVSPPRSSKRYGALSEDQLGTDHHFGAKHGHERHTRYRPRKLQHPLQRVHTRRSLQAWVQEQCQAAAGEVGAKFSLSFEGNGDVFLTKPGPFVDMMARAVQAITGHKPALTTNGGTSDARFIKDLCPVVEFGLRNATAHQIDEHVPIADLQALTAIYRRFIALFFA